MKDSPQFIRTLVISSLASSPLYHHCPHHPENCTCLARLYIQLIMERGLLPQNKRVYRVLRLFQTLLFMKYCRSEKNSVVFFSIFRYFYNNNFVCVYVNALLKHRFIHSLCLSPLLGGSREKEIQIKIPKN